MTDTCRWCKDTGLVTLIDYDGTDYDGTGYDVPCPGDCPAIDDNWRPSPAGGAEVPY